MCSFCGYINKDKKIIDDKQLKIMNETILKENVNGYNDYINSTTAICCNTYTTQPFRKIINDKEYIIVFNGELYNKDEITNDLINKGYDFDIKSDIREQCHTLKRISGLSELIYKEI